MEVAISSIIAEGRSRRDLGDIKALAASIADVGLLHPLVVTPGLHLIAGERRLAAVRSLGLAEVPVTVAEDLTEAAELLRAERDENTCRKDLTPTEAVALGARLEALEAPEAQRRMAATQARPGERVGPSKLDEPTARTDDRVGEAVGLGRMTYRKAKDVIAAAEAEPERFAPLVEEMDRTGKVDGAYKKLCLERAREAGTPPLPEGVFDVLYADPPWRYDFSETETREVENQYPTMALDEIKALAVSTIAHTDAVLFLWATSPLLRQALEVLDAWGFAYKTCMVWVKDRIGMGYWARQRHELLLIATKGNPRTPAPEDRPDSVIESPRTQHSAKPPEVYDLIERMFPDSRRVELFCRAPREGWTAWGNEAA